MAAVQSNEEMRQTSGVEGGSNLSSTEETRLGGRTECGERRPVLVPSSGDRGVPLRCAGNTATRAGVEERGGVHSGLLGVYNEVGGTEKRSCKAGILTRIELKSL